MEGCLWVLGRSFRKLERSNKTNLREGIEMGDYYYRVDKRQ